MRNHCRGTQGLVRYGHRRSRPAELSFGSADDRAAVLGDHDFDAFAAARELVRQDLASEPTGTASSVARNFVGAASGQARGDVVSATGTRIGDAPADGNWRGRCAANRSGLAAWVGSTASGGCIDSKS